MAKKIDFLIIGLSFESLYLAKKLKENNYSFKIINEKERLQESPFLNPLDSFFVKPCNNNDIPSTKKDITWKTFESGKWQPFIGFGSKKTDFDFSLYLQEEAFFWQKDKAIHIQELLDELNTNIYNFEKITKILLEEGNKAISEIVVNDQKSYKAESYIWTDSYKAIDSFIDLEKEGKKSIQKLAKSTFWTRLDLHLLHSSEEDLSSYAENRYLLMGGSVDAKPCLGNFYQNPEGQWCSQWSSFLKSKIAEDAESLGSLLREIKRQVKRPFEDLFKTVRFEKIQILSDIYNTYDCGQEGARQWLGLRNAFLFNHNFHSFVHKQNVCDYCDAFLEDFFAAQKKSSETQK